MKTPQIKITDERLIAEAIRILVEKEKELIIQNYMKYCFVNDLVYDVNVEIIIRGEDQRIVNEIIEQPINSEYSDKRVKESFKKNN
jgi:hypothetical protein